MCLYPKLILNKKYTANKKNGGVIPPVSDERTRYVPVGCGKCIECMKQKKREWQVRLLEEIKHDNTGKFVTLTFTEENLIKLENETGNNPNNYIRYNAVATLAVRRFLERWRKRYKKSVKHWLITELGQNETERIHLHGIIFTDESNETIEQIWKYGQIWVGNYVNEKTINYIIKYVSKIDLEHKEYKPKILTSSGIGKQYVGSHNYNMSKFRGDETREYYTTKTGHKIALPIYFRNKLYTEEEREKLWLQKLDKEERWIMGEKIDVSISDEDYEKALEYYREKNKRLGYGDDSVNWDEKMYKNNKKRIELRTRYLKELKKKNKNLDNSKDTYSFTDNNKTNTDFNRFNNLEL